MQIMTMFAFKITHFVITNLLLSNSCTNSFNFYSSRAKSRLW